MNAAIIIAGGVGNRMHMDIPKQFINIYDKPVIIYTLEGFQRHPEIDQIGVVCLEGWQETLRRYARQYGITKLCWIETGGKTGQESIRNGVYRFRETLADDDIAVVHDGIRPMVDSSVLSDVIRVAALYGNGVTSTAFTEQIFRVGQDGATTREYIPRDSVRKVATPQAYRYGDLYAAYQEAFAKEIGIYGSSYTNTMMVAYGPAEDAEIALGIVIEYGGGGARAGNLVADIFDAYYAMKDGSLAQQAEEEKEAEQAKQDASQTDTAGQTAVGQTADTAAPQAGQTAPAAQDAAPEGPAADTAQPAVQDGPDVAQAEQNPDAIAPEN